MQEQRLTPAEAELEAALASLQPSADLVDRDRLMYRAGYSAARRGRRLWQVTTALLATSISAMLAANGLAHRNRSPLIAQHEAPAVVLNVFSNAAWRPGSNTVPNANSYFVVRQEVLQKGLAALPVGKVGSGSDDPPLTVGSILGPTSRTPQRRGAWSNESLIIPGGQS